jgi:hypothetical protein
LETPPADTAPASREPTSATPQPDPAPELPKGGGNVELAPPSEAVLREVELSARANDAWHVTARDVPKSPERTITQVPRGEEPVLIEANDRAPVVQSSWDAGVQTKANPLRSAGTAPLRRTRVTAAAHWSDATPARSNKLARNPLRSN